MEQPVFFYLSIYFCRNLLTEIKENIISWWPLTESGDFKDPLNKITSMRSYHGPSYMITEEHPDSRLNINEHFNSLAYSPFYSYRNDSIPSPSKNNIINP